MTARSGDLDVTVESGALAIARDVAARLGGAFVPLDPERGAARVLARGVCLDLTDWRAPALESRLAAAGCAASALAGGTPGPARVSPAPPDRPPHAPRAPP